VMSPSRRLGIWGTVGLCCAGVALAGALQMSGVPESNAYQSVAMTRYYWFLSKWHWYEIAGLVAPLVIVAMIGFGRRVSIRLGGDSAARTGLAKTAAITGVTAIVVAALFARAGLATHSVARLQPLRIFQLVYVVMILVVGAALAKYVLQRSAMRWVVVFTLLAGVMVFVERRTYPESAHLELPGALKWSGSENPWEQAFVWISKNTPQDALFALDAHYITLQGEDAQGFRAIAERSVLPDYSKDGGVVANKPLLTAEWIRGMAAQTTLSMEDDATRMEALRPLGVGWVVLDRAAQTKFHCDYANGVVKVCRVP
jgi:hypothetical protein